MTMKTLQRRLNALDEDGKRHVRLELAKLTDDEVKAVFLESIEREDPEQYARYVAAPEADKEAVFLQLIFQR